MGQPPPDDLSGVRFQSYRAKFSPIIFGIGRNVLVQLIQNSRELVDEVGPRSPQSPRRQDGRQLINQPRPVVVQKFKPKRLGRDPLIHHEGVVRPALQILPARDLELVRLLERRVPRRVLVLDPPQLHVDRQFHDDPIDDLAVVDGHAYALM